MIATTATTALCRSSTRSVAMVGLCRALDQSPRLRRLGAAGMMAPGAARFGRRTPGTPNRVAAPLFIRGRASEARVPYRTHALVPPDGGWTLKEAAYALLPASRMGPPTEREAPAWYAHLSVDLLRAVFLRRDLYLSGPASDAGPSRVNVSCRGYPAATLYILSISEGTLRICPTDADRKLVLSDVRVEGVQVERSPDDFPDEAADALPLLRAVVEQTTKGLSDDYLEAQKRLRDEARWHYDPDHPNDRAYDTLSESDGHGHYLSAEVGRLWAQIKKEFVQALTKGVLTAWGRDASPLATAQEIPATAWRVLGVDNVRAGTVKGPHGTLYDVHVGRRFVMPRVAAPAIRGAQSESSGVLGHLVPDEAATDLAPAPKARGAVPEAQPLAAAQPAVVAPQDAPSSELTPPAKPDARPPAAGWTLRDAVAILCPRELALVEQGGPELTAWLEDRMGNLGSLMLKRGGAEGQAWYAWTWLFEAVLSEIRRKPALTIAGFDTSAAIAAERIRVPRGRLDDLALGVRLTGSYSDIHMAIPLGRITIKSGRAETALTDVRIVDADPLPDDAVGTLPQQASVSPNDAAPPMPSAPPPATPDSLEPFNAARLRSHYRLRIDMIGRGTNPIPTEDDDWAWAKAVMNGVSRNQIREVRKAILGDKASRRGPRRGAKRRI